MSDITRAIETAIWYKAYRHYSKNYIGEFPISDNVPSEISEFVWNLIVQLIYDIIHFDILDPINEQLRIQKNE